jgi:hypothetical protein
MNKYLRVRQEFLLKVTQRYTPNTVAVHVRGLDKRTEQGDIDNVNESYHKVLSDYSDKRILLITDSIDITNEYIQRYGDRVITTPSIKASGETGLHHSGQYDRVTLGIDILLDTYSAARADVFIGNGGSNVSGIVDFLRGSRPTILLSPNVLERTNGVRY